MNLTLALQNNGYGSFVTGSLTRTREIFSLETLEDEDETRTQVRKVRRRSGHRGQSCKARGAKTAGETGGRR